MKGPKKGIVFLIGAGPGKADLITVRGAELLKTADVVLYDRLISDELIHLIPESTVKKCVGGEHGSNPTDKQENIDNLMLKYVNNGLNVARLKIGDPFLFGRGGEEVSFLAKHGIQYEIVPGISSAFGVPTYSGIPLTHRDYASSIVVVSGHRKASYENDWKSIIKLGSTIIILMGVGTLKTIMQNLRKNGIKADMPVAIIENGTLSNERIIVGNVSCIAELAEKEAVHSPAIIVVGEVLRLASRADIENRVREMTRSVPCPTSP